MNEPVTPTEPVDRADEAARRARTEHRTRQILRAAARLMERSGSHAVSMQAVAEEAGVSVGLIYRYFSAKEDLLLGVIVEVLAVYEQRVVAAIASSGDDPVDRLAAGFRVSCEVMDEHRHAALLTYRESRSLGEQGLATIKRLEAASIEPMCGVLRDGIARGVFRPTDVEIVAYDLLVLAHAWTLKHWFFDGRVDLDAYVTVQFDIVLSGLRAG